MLSAPVRANASYTRGGRQVLEPNRQAMLQRLRGAHGVEEVLVIHDDFLNTSLKEAMLTSPLLVKVLLCRCLPKEGGGSVGSLILRADGQSVSKLLKLCQMFKEYLEVGQARAVAAVGERGRGRGRRSRGGLQSVGCAQPACASSRPKQRPPTALFPFRRRIKWGALTGAGAVPLGASWCCLGCRCKWRRWASCSPTSPTT